VDVKTAQVRLGHADPRLTIATYAQAVVEADRKAADSLGASFFGGERPGARDGRAMAKKVHTPSGHSKAR